MPCVFIGSRVEQMRLWSGSSFPKLCYMIDHSSIRDAFTMGSGSPVIMCACGRQNYADIDELMDEGEMDRLRKNDKNNPDKYYCQHEGRDTVSSVVVNGSDHVFGCPCKWEDRLEKFLIDHQNQFIRFYKNKISKDLTKAQIAAESIETL